MENISSLLDLTKDKDIFIFDVFGVLWDGNGFYDHVDPLLRQLKQMNKTVLILSNSTSMPIEMIKKWERFNIKKTIHYDHLLTSGGFLHHELNNGWYEKTFSDQSRFYILGVPNPPPLLNAIQKYKTENLTESDLIFLGIPDINGQKRTDIEPFLSDLEKIRNKNLPMVCANPDYYALQGDFKYIRQGFIAKWYEDHGGKVYWFGKPNVHFFNYALQGFNKEKCVMIGDTVRTDILGANIAQIDSVLLTKQGICATRLSKGDSLNDIILDEKAIPTFLLERI